MKNLIKCSYVLSLITSIYIVGIILITNYGYDKYLEYLEQVNVELEQINSTLQGMILKSKRETAKSAVDNLNFDIYLDRKEIELIDFFHYDNIKLLQKEIKKRP